MSIKKLNGNIEKINKLITELGVNQYNISVSLHNRINAIEDKAFERDSEKNTKDEIAKINKLYKIMNAVNSIVDNIEELDTIDINEYE